MKGGEFLSFSQKILEFSHKIGGVGKIGDFSKTGITYKLLQNLSFSLFVVCFFFPVIIYTISISILCVSQERLALLESNQQTYDLYNLVYCSPPPLRLGTTQQFFLSLKELRNLKSNIIQIESHYNFSMIVWI